MKLQHPERPPILTIIKKCPCCKKKIIIDVFRDIDDGYDLDERNTKIKIEKFTK